LSSYSGLIFVRTSSTGPSTFTNRLCNQELAVACCSAVEKTKVK
jgi:hypothetical protein